MAFKLTQKPTFKLKVKIYTPNEKGTFDTSELDVIYKRPNLSDLDELRELPGKEAMQKVIAGWEDMVDEDGQEVGFNDDNLQALLMIPQALKAINEAFWQGLFKAAEKN
jgi:hypothetical protein